MRRTPAATIVALTVVGVLVAVFVNLITNRWNPWILAVLLLLVAATAFLEVRRTRTAAPPPVDLDAAADRLAEAVLRQWKREEERRRLHDPRALNITWAPTGEVRMDHWSVIRRQATGGTSVAALPLTAAPNRIIDAYRRLPSGRLVVLGEAGSGKTSLMLRLVLDLLADRCSGGRVPVLFTLGAWDPAALPLREWLAAQLIRDHGSPVAAQLIEADRILPILDGFDELGPGLHRIALEALNATHTPLVLTSRVVEYKNAVEATDVLTAAAVVKLNGAEFEDVSGYLESSTARPVWQPVISRLDGNHALTTVLANPLMVMLARTIYSDRPERDPVELLDITSPHAIEDHLLTAYLQAAYGQRKLGQLGRWLTFLARRLDGLKTPNLAWWQLGNTISGLARGLLVGLGTGMLSGIAVGAASSSFLAALAMGVSVALGVTLTTSWGIVFLSRFVLGFASGALYSFLIARLRGFDTGWLLANGLVFGLMFGFTIGFTGGVDPEPSRLQLHSRRQQNRARRRIMFGLTGAVIVTIIEWIGHDRTIDIETLIAGPLFGAAVGITWEFVTSFIPRLTTPIDIGASASPGELLDMDRKNMFVQAGVLCLTVGVCYGLLIGLAQVSLEAGIRTGLAVGLVLAIIRMSGTAWFRWWILVRLWLPLRGQLPWRVPGFLEEAHRRGILRQVGAVYQFRHARLQEHFAGRA